MRYSIEELSTSCGTEYQIWDSSEYVAAVVYDEALAIKITDMLNAEGCASQQDKKIYVYHY